MFKVLGSTMIGAAAVIALMGLAAQAQDKGKKNILEFDAEAKSGEIKVNEIAHIRAGGIAGAETKATVKGPAKIEVISSAITDKEGKVLIGGNPKVVEVLPTGKGIVDVAITVVNPTAPKDSIKRTFKLTVK